MPTQYTRTYLQIKYIFRITDYSNVDTYSYA